jgi:aldose 1-epimerase
MIDIKYKKQHLVVNKLGAGIAQYFLKNKDGIKNIIYGYSNLYEKDGSMGDILSPFPGRVEKAKYQFNGKDFNLKNINLKDSHAIHGFVKDREWSFKKDDNRLSAKLILDGQKENLGYPFRLDHEVEYTLGNKGLRVEIAVKNLGNSRAPFGIGFHPYFTFDCPVDQINLSFNAEKIVEFNQDLKPTGKLLDIKNSQFDFNKFKKIGDLIVDNCFTGLRRDQKANHYTRLSHRGREITIWQDESFSYLQLYSADTKKEPLKRRALAVEPQTCSGFAFNVPKMGLKILEPGDEFKGSWGVKI